MCASRLCWGGVLVAFVMLAHPGSGRGGEVRAGKNPKLGITHDRATGKISVSWRGRGVLKSSSGPEGPFRSLHKRPGTYWIEPTQPVEIFRLEAESGAGAIYSQNVVGYAMLDLPPGLSLIANPLYYTNNALSFWWPNAPDGAQVFKYTEGSGYEVSTFDGLVGAWSNPDLDVPIGTGFFFRNPTTTNLVQLFVGEVLQGTLVNPLPAGYSTKGSLVPQEGSINAPHGIPGQAGDEIRTYVNDLQGGGTYNVSSYVDETEGWVPDLILGVGQGFWIQKVNPQDWVRVFYVN